MEEINLVVVMSDQQLNLLHMQVVLVVILRIQINMSLMNIFHQWQLIPIHQNLIVNIC
jgi:hypothetical protein